jgi:hypothetical protein
MWTLFPYTTSSDLMRLGHGRNFGFIRQQRSQ